MNFTIVHHSIISKARQKYSRCWLIKLILYVTVKSVNFPLLILYERLISHFFLFLFNELRVVKLLEVCHTLTLSIVNVTTVIAMPTFCTPLSIEIVRRAFFGRFVTAANRYPTSIPKQIFRKCVFIYQTLCIGTGGWRCLKSQNGVQSALLGIKLLKTTSHFICIIMHLVVILVQMWFFLSTS